MPSILEERVLRRILVAKQFLLATGDPLTPHSDAIAIARAILTAHDSAELAVAAIADQLTVPGITDHLYLLDYIAKIEQHTDRRPLPGASFFKTLNTARRAFKHEGILPDSREWHRVVEHTWRHLDECCFRYLDTPLEEIDLTGLLTNPAVKELCLAARGFIQEAKIQEALECIGKALYSVLDSLPGVSGERTADRAMMLTAYGIRPSEFISLQDFVPRIRKNRETGELEVQWELRGTGHPANWTGRNATFCLETVTDIALKTQHTPWHPRPIPFHVVYEDVITALRDDAPLWRRKAISILSPTPSELEEVAKLTKGDSRRGVVHMPSTLDSSLAAALGPKEMIGDLLSISITTEGAEGFVHFNRADFTTSYEPRDDEVIRKYWPHVF